MLTNCLNNPQKENGFTLIEVLITIVVISIAATAIMGVYISTVSTSADPLIQQQAVSIAQAYMEEIQGQHFADPVVAETGGAEVGETRANYNDVQDYADPSVDGVITDQNNVAIAGLAGYSIAVDVSAASLDSITQLSGNAMRIDITVMHAAIDPIRLSGFRVNH